MRLGDRVANLMDFGAVEFGARGTVVGIEAEGLDVLWDRSCPQIMGLRVPNLEMGSRVRDSHAELVGFGAVGFGAFGVVVEQVSPVPELWDRLSPHRG